jgi:hypothetical protein
MCGACKTLLSESVAVPVTDLPKGIGSNEPTVQTQEGVTSPKKNTLRKTEEGKTEDRGTNS